MGIEISQRFEESIGERLYEFTGLDIADYPEITEFLTRSLSYTHSPELKERLEPREKESVEFGEEWIRLTSDGADPVPALLWLLILREARNSINSKTEDRLKGACPMTLFMDEPVLNISIEERQDAIYVSKYLSPLIGKLSTDILGTTEMYIEVWDEDFDVFRTGSFK